jgi:hypothetical protein
MPRGVMAIADTRDEAERQVLNEASQLRVLRSREIDLSGLPPLLSGPLARHWVVVVEHADPEEESELPQHDDPETRCERETRQMYLKLAINPELLVSGVIEEFACPACDHKIRVELRAPREARYPEHATCPECQTHLKRAKGGLTWDTVESTPKAYPRCIFCGAPANSREHVIPAWISKRLGVRDFLSAEDALLAGGIARRKQPISFASYRARIFCGGCNAHFKHLEDAVIPLIVPMARGRTVSLDQESQALLALWADKTAMALIAATPELREALPASHRRAVQSEGRVADDTWIAFFPWRGGPVISTGQAVVANNANPMAAHEHYAAILTFAKLGFYVIGFTEPVGPEDVIDGERPPLRQFWPQKSHLIHWPPPTVTDNKILPGLLSFAPLRRA